MENIDVQKESDRVRNALIEVKQDVEILVKWIDDALKALDNVKTTEDALAFDSSFANMEKSLKHIRIF